MEILDNLPIATLSFLALIVGALIALATGSLDFQQFAISVGAGSVGIAGVGEVRNRAGRGIKK
jgi:ABC-type microcin C transport system permease subunit YejE